MSTFDSDAFDSDSFDADPFADARIDHVAKAISRLPEQLKNSAVLIALIKALLTPAQEIEDTFFALLALKSIDDATDAMLDLIGKLVGQLRNGNTDLVYRNFIRVRLAINRSRGLRSDYVKIISLIYPSAKIEVRAKQATSEVTVHGVVINAADAQALLGLLQQTHGAGVRVVLGTFSQTEATTFAWRLAAVLGANTSIGAGSFTFTAQLDVLQFPVTGYVRFQTTGEVVLYTISSDWTTLNVRTPGLVQAHTAGEIIELCDAAGLVLNPELGGVRGWGVGLWACGQETIDT